MQFLKKIISFKRFSFLLSQLVRRDFKVRYRGSVLGVLWSVLNPLLNMIIISIVFSQVFRAVDNYKMHILSGLVIFNFFSEATNLALTSVTSNFGLITKVYFPKFILPLSKVFSSAINLVITMVVFCILGTIMDVDIWTGYLLIPYVMICTFIFAAGISFIVATLQVFFRDTQHIYSLVLTVWMYATPIIYNIDIIPEWAIEYFKLNPLFVFIDFLRELTLRGSLPNAMSFLACALWAVGTFCVGAFVFVKSQNKFIYYS